MRPLTLALRALVRQPGLSLMIVLTLALGIGAGTALFAYVIAIFRPVVDGPEPDRMVFLHAGTEDTPRQLSSYVEFQHLAREQTAVEGLAGFSPFGTSVRVGEDSTFAWGQAVTGGHFSFFAARPALGRLLQPADDRPGAERVVVLAHSFWRGTLGGDPAAVGRRIRINGLDFLVVGVAARGFQGTGTTPSLYVPMAQLDEVSQLSRLADPHQRFVVMIGRLAPGLGLEQARAALRPVGRGLDESLPLASGEKRRLDIALIASFDEAYAEDPLIRSAQVLLAAAGLFLLLACANVANLLLARAVERQREWGVPAALGASRTHLLGGILAESAWLCLAGGALGMVFAVALSRRIEGYVMTTFFGIGNFGGGADLIRLDVRVAAFALGCTLACALLCGLAPVLQATRRDLLAVLKSESGGTAAPTGPLAVRKALVVAQVALSVLLLLGGSLLVRTLHAAQQVDPGFPVDRLLFVTYYIPSRGTPGEEKGTVTQRVLDAARATPGVAAASLAYAPPLAGWWRETRVTTAGRTGEPLTTGYNMVASGFFATTGIPLLQGRELDERDRGEGTGAVVVSRALARELWGSQDPVGRLLTVDEPVRPGNAGPVFQVVGMAADVRQGITDPPGPSLYFSSLQRRAARMTLLVRTAAPPEAVIPDLRRALRAAHPDLSLVEVATCRESLRRSLTQPRMHAEVAGLFALLGLGVAVIGLFGLLRYTVSLRGREIAIRMAVGARPRDVLALILRQGLALTAAGLALGLLGAFGLTRLLASLLFGVDPADPLTFVAVPALLTLVTVSACWLPARRAAQVDPVAVLRE